MKLLVLFAVLFIGCGKSPTAPMQKGTDEHDQRITVCLKHTNNTTDDYTDFKVWQGGVMIDYVQGGDIDTLSVVRDTITIYQYRTRFTFHSSSVDGITRDKIKALKYWPVAGMIIYLDNI